MIELLIHAAYGKARLDSAFDLASLTKPLSTTAAAMLLEASSGLSTIADKMSEEVSQNTLVCCQRTSDVASSTWSGTVSAR